MLPSHRVQPDRQLSSWKLSALSFALVRGFQWALETNPRGDRGAGAGLLRARLPLTVSQGSSPAVGVPSNPFS
jgi:hypothetical protein